MNRLFRNTWRYALAATALMTFALVITACGGGGGSSSSGGLGGLGVFVTDAFSDDFSHVWVTLYHIDASADGATYQALFDDPNGKQIDVATLANAAQLLSSINVPAGTYSSVRLTFGDHILLVPKNGGASIDAPVDDRIGVHTNSKVTLSLTAQAAVAAGHLTNLVIDFDLAAFELVGGQVRPSVHKGDDNRFEHADKRAELSGTVSNLVAGSSFDLTIASGKSISVVITSTTAIFSSNSGAAASLANGQAVEVKGAVDPNTHTVTADRIKIEDAGTGTGDDHGGHHDDHGTPGAGAEGTVASVDSAAKSFTLTPEEAEHFRPSGGTITVTTDANTVFAKRHQDAASFGDVAAGAKAEVTGSFDATTNTIAAVRVEIH